MTPEQRQIAAAKRLGVNRPVDEVLALVRALLDFDAAMAAKRKKAGCSIPLAILAAIAAFIASGFANGAVATILKVVAFLCIAAMVGAIVLFVRFKSQDLSDNLRAAAVPFLAILREDMNPTDPLHVEIDLRPYAIGEKLKHESDPYKTGSYYKIVDRLYVDPWFEGSAALADGTKVRWKVIEHVLQKSKTKRGSRGKIKSKTKVKRKTVGVVTLSFPMKHYAIKSNDADTLDEKRATVTLARKAKTDRDESPAFGLLVDLIADGYRRVRASA